jgi:L-arabinose isomerase
MIDLSQFSVWFVTGSQHLYGEEALQVVAANAREVVAALDGSAHIPANVVFKPVVTTPDAIAALCEEASGDPSCIGLITWMHTFSPAKMWIAGLSALRKPFLHLHTQFNRELPWPTIDMDFMNLNQAAHGDREFGYIATRLGLRRKVVAGTGLTARCRRASAPGRAPPPPGRTRRGRASRASATTCARWR